MSIEVREAGLSDIDTLVSWGRDFHKASPWRHAHYDEAAVRQILTDTIESETAVVFMHDKGMIAGFIMPLWLSPDHKIAHELFWWATEGGGVLLKALEKWAEEQGANEIVMVGLHEAGDRVKRIYEAKGYLPKEYSYSKRL